MHSKFKMEYQYQGQIHKANISNAAFVQKHLDLINFTLFSPNSLTLSYSANFAPSNENNSKLSKRFQLCPYDEHVHNCSLKQGDCGSERTIEFPERHSARKELKIEGMPNSAHLADYLGIWILGIDFHPNTASCIEAEGDCEFNVKNSV
jgi:hypothetical protein